MIDCYIPVDRETGQHRGFAFVTMDPDDALRAADETDGYELDGRILRVNEAPRALVVNQIITMMAMMGEMLMMKGIMNRGTGLTLTE